MHIRTTIVWRMKEQGGKHNVRVSPQTKQTQFSDMNPGLGFFFFLSSPEGSRVQSELKKFDSLT